MIQRHPYILTLLVLALLILTMVVDAVFVRLPSAIFLVVLVAVITLCAVSYQMIKKKSAADLQRDMDAKKKKLREAEETAEAAERVAAEAESSAEE